jgi:hypothetical protein
MTWLIQRFIGKFYREESISGDDLPFSGQIVLFVSKISTFADNFLNPVNPCSHSMVCWNLCVEKY